MTSPNSGNNLPSRSNSNSGSNEQANLDLNGPRSLPPVKWLPPPDQCLAEWGPAESKITIRYGEIVGGPGKGVQVVEIDNGPMQITLLPTRGMSIWQIVCDGVPFKWNSPINGPIHPALVPVFDPSGLGWLEGFDEMFVRCGLVSNRAPDFDPTTNYRYPLHGRIANLPAQEIWCETSNDGVTICGRVIEQRLFFNNLELQVRLKVGFGEHRIQIVDKVTNCAAFEIDTQMLYHINVGKPVLGEGAKLIAAPRELAPRDSRAAEDFDRWDSYEPPTVGFLEAVNFFNLATDERNQSSVLLQSSCGETGLGVSWDPTTLPCFVQWKNSAADQDGYVTGLEPATNFPNTRSFESRQGRVVTLQPKQSVRYHLELDLLTNQSSVDDLRSRIQETATQISPTIHRSPKSGWSDV